MWKSLGRMRVICFTVTLFLCYLSNIREYAKSSLDFLNSCFTEWDSDSNIFLAGYPANNFLLRRRIMGYRLPLLTPTQNNSLCFHNFSLVKPQNSYCAVESEPLKHTFTWYSILSYFSQPLVAGHICPTLTLLQFSKSLPELEHRSKA